MWGACAAPPPLTERAFVWQRRWTPEVEAAVRDEPHPILLVGERESDGRWQTTGALAARPPRQVDVAVRLAALGDPPPWGEVVGLVQAAEAAGWRVGRVLLDVDVPTSGLAAYAAVLPALRDRLAPRPLEVLALPAWIGPDWPALVASVDRVVLQVHGLTVPSGGDPWIFRADHAEDWARSAVGYGPVRVALPLHGWRVSTGSGPVDVRAEPAEVLELLRAIEAEPIAGLEGFDWFRLPVAGDPGTWPAPAWAAVRAGRLPTSTWRSEIREVGPTTWEVLVVGAGEDAVPAPVVAVRGEVVLGEGLGGYRFAASSDGGRFEPDPALRPSPLSPGEQRVIGFVRAHRAPAAAPLR